MVFIVLETVASLDKVLLP